MFQQDDDLRFPDLETGRVRYYCYLKYLVSSAEFNLPEGLSTPHDVLEMRIKSESCDVLSAQLNTKYFAYIKKHKSLTHLDRDTAFSIMVATFCTAPQPISIDELNECIEQSCGMFPKQKSFDKFELEHKV